MLPRDKYTSSLIMPNHPNAPRSAKSLKASQKRAIDRKAQLKKFEHHGIEYTTRNDAVHVIVTGFLGYIDFWPGTGKWKTRDQIKGFGIDNLIERIEAGLA